MRFWTKLNVLNYLIKEENFCIKQKYVVHRLSGQKYATNMAHAIQYKSTVSEKQT